MKMKDNKKPIKKTKRSVKKVVAKKQKNKKEIVLKKSQTKRKSLLFGVFLGLIIVVLSAVSLIVISVKSQLIADSSSQFGEEICYSKNFLLPKLHTVNIEGWSYSFDNTVSFLDYPVYSNRICFTPSSERYAQEPLDASLNLLSANSVQSSVKAVYLPPASVISIPFTVQKVQPSAVVTFELDREDGFYTYFFFANGKAVPCIVEGISVKCDLAGLSLQQSKVYDYKLWRVASSVPDDDIEILLTGKFETNIANVIKSVSVGNKSTIYDYGQSIKIIFTKKLQRYENLTLSKDGKEISVKTTLKDNYLEIKPVSSLPGDSKFMLSIKNVFATDNSYLDNPFLLTFYTAGGPKATRNDAPSYDYKSGRKISIYFDQSLASGQNVAQKIVTSPSRKISVGYTGNRIMIYSISGFGACETITITVKAGLNNKYGFPSKSDYSFKTRSTCARVSSVGASVQGRGITAYTFGTGSKTILFYGAIHGSEANTKSLMSAWINELERNAGSIPSNKKVIVIPSANPDGIARGDRFNRNGVDLNRNWGSADWQQGTYLNGGVYYPNGGGSAPFSEPESRAIRNVMTANRPYLTIAYHSKAGYSIYNAYGSSSTYARTYASLARYALVNGMGSSGFDYSATGSYSAWARENGLTALTIELATKTSSETSRNFPAMWRMVKW